jgi:hypothetical protein
MIPPFYAIAPLLLNEDTTIKFLFDNRILYTAISCATCGSTIRIEGRRYRCQDSKCRTTASILKDSFFSKTKLKASEVLAIGYFWLCGFSRDVLMRITHRSPNTITDFLAHYRQLVTKSLKTTQTKIGGLGIIVEIDESKF